MKFKKIIFFLASCIAIYLINVFVLARKYENVAEKYVEEALFDFANPWNPERLKKRASSWFLYKSKLTPDYICRLADVGFGNIIKIVTPVKCNLQQGYDKFSTEKHTYAICTTSVEFQRELIEMQIRLISKEGRWTTGDWQINDFISMQEINIK